MTKQMKNIIRALLIISLSFFSVSETYSQINLKKLLDKTKKKTEKKIENRIEKRLDKGVDKTLDSLENGIDGKKGAKGSKASKAQPELKQKSAEINNNQAIDSSAKTNINWKRYDFIPGDELFFEDTQRSEQNGEFPSKWDLVAGTIENANVNNENVIYFRETGNFPNGIVPLLREPSADYLPEAFTMEFDCYFEKGKYTSYRVYFYDVKSKLQKPLNDEFIDILPNMIRYSRGEINGQYPNTQSSNIDKDNSFWRHIAISFNKRALKVYMDDTRLINVPNIKENYSGVTLSTNHSRQDKNQFIKNVYLAKGAVPLYDKLLTDGKIVTTGIRFDVNKATIKEESMGVINDIYKIMNNYPDLRFSIQGHTDSDGAEAMNKMLSDMRAKAVMERLIEMGISADRLESVGFGESKPVNSNSTPEEKALNRRVEFVKL